MAFLTQSPDDANMLFFERWRGWSGDFLTQDISDNLKYSQTHVQAPIFLELWQITFPNAM